MLYEAIANDPDFWKWEQVLIKILRSSFKSRKHIEKALRPDLEVSATQASSVDKGTMVKLIYNGKTNFLMDLLAQFGQIMSIVANTCISC